MRPASFTDFAVTIPRIGQEVIIDFIEGDPDQPIITGCVYNADQMPPYELPNNAHTMGFKSNTTKGGKGYNEIVIVDDKKNELIRTHANKDRDTTVKNDDRRKVFRNREVKVFGWQTEEVTKDMTTTVSEGNQANTVKAGNQTNTTAADSYSNTAAVQNVMAVGSDSEAGCSFSGAITIKDDGTVDINAVTKITLSVGGSSITVEPGKITIVSPDIELNP